MPRSTPGHEARVVTTETSDYVPAGSAQKLMRRADTDLARRAKLVQLTAAAHASAARAEEMLDKPPGALLNLPQKDLAALVRTLELLQQHDADPAGA